MTTLVCEFWLWCFRHLSYISLSGLLTGHYVRTVEQIPLSCLEMLRRHTHIHTKHKCPPTLRPRDSCSAVTKRSTWTPFSSTSIFNESWVMPSVICKSLWQSYL